MPNWASCSYKLYGRAEHLQEIMTAYKAVRNDQSEATRSYLENKRVLEREGFSDATIVKTLSQCGIFCGDGDVWLCDILKKLGFTDDEMRDAGNVRGYLCDDPQLSTGHNCLSFDCETAWSDADGFIELLKQKYEDLEHSFTCEESGCEVYITNDSDVAGTRVVNSEQGDYQRCATDEEFAEFIAELAHSNNDADIIETAEQAEAYVRDRNERADRERRDDHIWVHVFELSD